MRQIILKRNSCMLVWVRKNWFGFLFFWPYFLYWNNSSFPHAPDLFCFAIYLLLREKEFGGEVSSRRIPVINTKCRKQVWQISWKALCSVAYLKWHMVLEYKQRQWIVAILFLLLYKKSEECPCVQQASNIGAEITLLKKWVGNSGDYKTAFPSSKLETVTLFSVRLCESQLWLLK